MADDLNLDRYQEETPRSGWTLGDVGRRISGYFSGQREKSALDLERRRQRNLPVTRALGFSGFRPPTPAVAGTSRLAPEPPDYPLAGAPPVDYPGDIAAARGRAKKAQNLRSLASTSAPMTSRANPDLFASINMKEPEPGERRYPNPNLGIMSQDFGYESPGVDRRSRIGLDYTMTPESSPAGSAGPMVDNANPSLGIVPGGATTPFSTEKKPYLNEEKPPGFFSDLGSKWENMDEDKKANLLTALATTGLGMMSTYGYTPIPRTLTQNVGEAGLLGMKEFTTLEKEDAARKMAQTKLNLESLKTGAEINKWNSEITDKLPGGSLYEQRAAKRIESLARADKLGRPETQIVTSTDNNGNPINVVMPKEAGTAPVRGFHATPFEEKLYNSLSAEQRDSFRELKSRIPPNVHAAGVGNDKMQLVDVNTGQTIGEPWNRHDPNQGIKAWNSAADKEKKDIDTEHSKRLGDLRAKMINEAKQKQPGLFSANMGAEQLMEALNKGLPPDRVKFYNGEIERLGREREAMQSVWSKKYNRSTWAQQPAVTSGPNPFD